jgi:putative transposase
MEDWNGSVALTLEDTICSAVAQISSYYILWLDTLMQQSPHKGFNNRAENSHLPFRRRERARQGFRSPRHLQRFVSAFSAVRNLFVPSRSSRSAAATHLHRLNAMVEWKFAANIAA